MLRLCVWVLVMFLLGTLGSFAAEWEYIYEADKFLPDDPALGDEAWKVFNKGIKTSEVAEITSDGELHIVDPNNKVCFFFRDHNKLTKTTLEARMKALSQSGAMYTVCLEIEDGADTTYLGLFPDHIQLVGGDTSSRHAITFGAGSTGGAAEHYWDYVAYTTAGAFTPDELPDYFSTAMAVEASGKLTVRWAELKVR